MSTPKILVVGLIATIILLVAVSSSAKDEQLPNPLEVKIEASRSRPSAGTSISILVRVRNISQNVVFLDKKASTLVFPSELSVDEHSIGRGFIFFGDDEKALFYRLNPGDDIRMFVSTPDSPETANLDAKQGQPVISNFFSPALQFTKNIGRFLSFAPGDFKVTALLVYTTKLNDPNSVHIKSEDLSVSVSAPQSVILLGAAVGGILAYLLLPQTGSPRRWFRHVYAIATSALLGITVTILLSRIAETQFFIRITITDFWGAIAMGFIAGYSGRAVLERITSTGATVLGPHANTNRSGLHATPQNPVTPPVSTPNAGGTDA